MVVSVSKDDGFRTGDPRSDGDVDRAGELAPALIWIGVFNCMAFMIEAAAVGEAIRAPAAIAVARTELARGSDEAGG